MKTRSGAVPTCSSCGKARDEVMVLLNMAGVYICDECVALSNEIIEEELEAAGRSWSWRRRDEPAPSA